MKFPLKKRFKGYHKKDVAFTEVDIIVVKPNKERLNDIVGQREQFFVDRAKAKADEEQ